jgi:hypothetical protein
MINNTDPFNGFDITLNSSDTSKLKPYGVDLTGSMLPAGSTTLIVCVGGVLILGNICSATDNPTTVRVAAVGPFGFLSLQGATGLLFTAIFSISGTTPIGGVKISYQNGCPNGSVAGAGKICVTVTNGTIIPVTEATRGGGFDNSNTATLPYATLSTTTINLGQSLAGAPTHALPSVTYTATAKNGFNTSSTPQLTMAVAFNGTGIRPTVSLNTTFLDLTNLKRHNFTQTGNVPSTVPAGVYTATVTATYQTQDTITFGAISSLSAAYSLPVNVTDYVVSASPSPVRVQPPGSQPVTVTISPKGSFNTLVKLDLTIPTTTLSAGIGAAYSSSTVSGGSGISTLTITTTASTLVGTYTLTILSNSTLSGFTKSHTTTLTIQITGFIMTATSPGSQTVGTAETSKITIGYLNGFSGTITLLDNTVTNLSCLAINPASFSANGTATVQCTSLVAGSYFLNIQATTSSRSISTTVIFTFTFHDVAISSVTITPTGQAPVGTKITVTVQLQNKGGVDENVLVALLVDSVTIQPTQNVTVLANSSQPVTLYWNSSKYTARAYNITITIQLSQGAINSESSQQILSKTIGSYSLQPVAGSSTFDTTTIAIVAGIIVAAAVAGSVLLFRSRRTPSNGAQPGTQ